MDFDIVMGILALTVHMLCAVLLIGTPLYSWLSGTPISKRLKGSILSACLVVILSGSYTLITKAHTPPGYHMWFGMKILLVMHIIGVHFVMAIKEMTDEKKVRLATGVAISGILVVLLSVVLRSQSIGV